MTTQTAPKKQELDKRSLEIQVKEMYRKVAVDPHGEFHFEMGRGLTERLGYPAEDLDRIPAEAVESFAGVGYYFHLADLRDGETVLDLGSGSGTDTFVAALKVGPGGKVIGVDMTDEQRAKAERLRDEAGFTNITYQKGYIEDVSSADDSVDAVIDQSAQRRDLCVAPGHPAVEKIAENGSEVDGRRDPGSVLDDRAHQHGRRQQSEQREGVGAGEPGAGHENDITRAHATLYSPRPGPSKLDDGDHA